MFRGNKQKTAAQIRANSNQTMTWKDKTSKHSRKSEMRESIFKSKSSLTAENMFQAVLLPNKPDYYVEDPNSDKEEIYEWWAENTLDFYNELLVLLGVLTEQNDGWTAVLNSATSEVPYPGYPKNVQYLWKANRDSKAKQLPVDVYIDHVLTWINVQIEDEDIFPTNEDVPFDSKFPDHAKKIFKRMFRIFAIFYCNEVLYKRAVVQAHLETVFKHFLYFCWKWDLVSTQETKCIDPIVSPIYKKFKSDERKYRDRQLPLKKLGNEEQ